MWNWPDPYMDISAAFAPSEGIDLEAEVQSRTQLPILLLNDATAGCQAQHTYRRSKARANGATTGPIGAQFMMQARLGMMV